MNSPLKRSDMARDSKEITRFYLPLAHDRTCLVAFRHKYDEKSKNLKTSKSSTTIIHTDYILCFLCRVA